MAVDCIFNIANAMVSVASIGLGGVIGFFSARKISDRNARATASAKLRAAFAPALAKIDLHKRHGSTHDQPDVTGFFKSAALDHAASIEEFRVFVPACKNTSYQKAWDQYFQSVRDQQIDAWDTEKTQEGDHEWHIVVRKINAILDFAKT